MTTRQDVVRHTTMTTANFVIGVDVGGSATQAVLFTHSAQPLNAITGVAANPHVIGFTASAAEICRLITELLLPHPYLFPSSVAICLSGGESSALRERYCVYLQAVLKCPLSSHILIVHDAVAPLGFIIPSANIESNNLGLVTLIGGTGSVAAGFTVSAGGENLLPNKCVCVEGEAYTIHQRYKCGGWGPLLGDKGSGYWVSTVVLATALQIWDGMDTAGNGVSNGSEHDVCARVDEKYMATKVLELACNRLLECAIDEVSLTDLNKLVAQIHNPATSRGDIASLCADFSFLAVQGNTICKRAFHAAGTELGRLFCMALQHLLSDSVCISLNRVRAIATGGVFAVWDSVDEFSTAFRAVAAPFLKAGIAFYVQNRQCRREVDYDIAFACARLSMTVASNKRVSESTKTTWENACQHMLLQIP